MGQEGELGTRKSLIPLFTGIVVLAGSLAGCATQIVGTPEPEKSGVDAGTYPEDNPSGDDPLVLLETLTVRADGSLTQSAAYSNSETLRIQVLGEYQWGICDSVNCPGGNACDFSRFGDAFYRTDDCWETTTEGFADVNLRLDGSIPEWGPYEQSHVYSVDRSGNDGPFELHLADCVGCYGDNDGSLEVQIWQAQPTIE